MIKIENVQVVGWEPTIRGMRNPKNSWDRIDSFPCDGEDCLKSDCPYGYCTSGEFNDDCECMKPDNVDYVVGPNDRDLIMRLAKGGPVHAKYRRMIVVYLDITAPLYWWKEFDTYKVGTVANSCSTMHKIQAKEIVTSDFSFDVDLLADFVMFERCVEHLVETCEYLRKQYNHYINQSKREDITESERKHFIRTAKAYWRMLIQLLPASYNQKRTVMLNYEVLVNMYESRRGHKLEEWRDFCEWIETLPYSEIITGKKENK